MLLKLASLKRTNPDVFYSILVASICTFAEFIFIFGGFSARLGQTFAWTIPVEANFFLNTSVRKMFEEQYVFYALLILFASIISLAFTVTFSILRARNAKLRSAAIVMSLIYLFYLTSLFLIGYKSDSSSYNRFWNDALRAGADWFYLVTPFWIPVRIAFVSMLLSFSITNKHHN